MPNASVVDYNNPFPSRLRDLMKNTTQKELADYIGVTRQSVSQYMDGSSQPVANKVSLIADYFNVTSDYLLGRTDAQKPENINVVEKYGLSEEAIRALMSIKDMGYISAFNLFISSPHFPQFLETLGLYHYHHEWPQNEASEDELKAFAEDEKYQRYECWRSMDKILDDIAKIAKNKSRDLLGVMAEVKKELSNEETDNTDDTHP